MAAAFADEIGFCNHCATFDVPVRVPWSAPQIALCFDCFAAYCEAMDASAEAFRALSRPH